MDGERLIELRRTTVDTPHFRGIEFIESEAKSIINHVPKGAMPFEWTVNPYRGCSHACVFCFARQTHTYLDMNAGRDFESKIVVKVNAVELLRKELKAKRWKGEPIAMGTATDPYQRAEGRYKLMPGIIGALIGCRNPFSILTKGTLILRDLALLEEAASLMEVSTALSIGTLDEKVWRSSEPGTPHPRKRLEAVAKLNDARVPCGVMVAPILPGISDREDQLREVVTGAIEAGATFVSPILLHLRPVVRDVYMEWLAQARPDLVKRYEATYKGSYAPTPLRNATSALVARLVVEAGGLRPRVPRRPGPWRGSNEGRFGVKKSRSRADSEPVQLELSLGGTSAV
jgi:DNA repair photolyase